MNLVDAADQNPPGNITGLYSDAALSFAIHLLEEIDDLVAAVNAELHVVALNAPFRRTLQQASGRAPRLGESLVCVLGILIDPATAQALCLRVAQGESFTSATEAVSGGTWDISFRRINNTHGQSAWTGIVMRAAPPRQLQAERERAELALQRERAQLQAVLDHAPVLISIRDLESRMVLANRAIFDALPVPPPAQFIGRSTFEVYPPALAQVQRESDLAALRARAPVRVERAIQHRDGSWHTYLVVKFPLFDPGKNEPYGICAISTDITARKQADEARERLLEQLRSAAASADRNRAQLEAIFQSIGDGVMVYDMHGGLVMLNLAQARILGFDSIREVQHAPDRSQPYELVRPGGELLAMEEWPLARVLRGETLDDLELCGRHRETGEDRFFSFSGAPARDEHGKQLLAVVVTRDISERKRLEQSRQESERRLNLAVSIAHLGFWELDVERNECYYSPQWKRQIGYRDEEISSSPREWSSRLHPEERELVLKELRAFIQQPTSEYRFEYRLRHRDGSYRHMVANGIPASGPRGGLAVIGIQLDATDSRLAEQRVLEAALHDPLTGLPNRALIFEYASRMLAAANRNRGRGSILFIDLDRFKPINDLYGHDLGDRLLKEVAQRLLSCVRHEDMVGRLGGDEFIIVLPHAGDSALAATVAQHVLEALACPFYIHAIELSVSASIGISHFPQHGADVDALIHAADMAMYRTKRSGRGHFHIYSPDMNGRADESAAIESRLKNALHRDGLALHYQPVVDMGSGRVIGAEALLRLRTDDGSAIGPDCFIPVAEAAGMISQLGEWVAIEACRQHAAWRDEGLLEVTIAINVSPLQFRQRGFAERLEEIVRHAGIDPCHILLEVTESAVMENVEEAIQTLHRIRSTGMQIALDDFGTGYSSLSHLSNLPLDKLKVDQSFVRRLEHDPASRAITGAIIALGRTLKLEMVGEGIESENAMSYLRDHGCDQAQGYLISHPLPPAAFAQWARTNRRQGGRPSAS
jgi:diguanylate cyclase (GGDEF)-like protein/PAS domain S-box-containing protein